MNTVLEVKKGTVETGAEGVIIGWGLRKNQIVEVYRSPNARISLHAEDLMRRQAAEILRKERFIKRMQPSLF